MSVLVIGGTGTVGSQVVRELVGRGAQVSVLTRDAAKAAGQPAGVTGIVGSLQEPATVRRIFHGVDAVFMANTMGPTEAQEALLAICGMRLAKLARVVYMSVQDADRAAWLPHFGAKVGAETALRRSGLAFTILRPSNFFQNDLWLKDALLGPGLYPTPLGGVGVSRVDVRDIAEAAAITLLTTGHEGEMYDVVGPDVLTGEAVAAAWSRALGKPIAYAGDDVDAWAERQRAYGLPDWLIFDVKLMFEYFQQAGLKAPPDGVARVTRLLGHPPRSFDAFATETARAWRAQH